MKNSKSLWLLISSGALVLMAGCQNPSQTNLSKLEQPTVSQQSSQNTQGQSQLEILTHSPQDIKNYQVALDSSDSNECKKIVETAYQTECITAVSDQKIYLEATTKLEDSVCAKMSTKARQDDCSSKVLELKNIQIDQQKNTEKFASMQDQYLKLIESGNYTECKNLSDVNYQKTCELTILTNKAKELSDPSWCLKASTKEVQANCSDNLKVTK